MLITSTFSITKLYEQKQSTPFLTCLSLLAKPLACLSKWFGKKTNQDVKLLGWLNLALRIIRLQSESFKMKEGEGGGVRLIYEKGGQSASHLGISLED